VGQSEISRGTLSVPARAWNGSAPSLLGQRARVYLFDVLADHGCDELASAGEQRRASAGRKVNIHLELLAKILERGARLVGDAVLDLLPRRVLIQGEPSAVRRSALVHDVVAVEDAARFVSGDSGAGEPSCAPVGSARRRRRLRAFRRATNAAKRRLSNSGASWSGETAWFPPEVSLRHC